MLHKKSKRLCERLVPIMSAVALPAALCTAWYAVHAQAREAEKPAAASSSASVADEALVPALPASLEQLPAPAVAPPVNRKKPASVHVELEARPVTGLGEQGERLQDAFNQSRPPCTSEHDCDRKAYDESGTRGRKELGADPAHPEGPGNASLEAAAA
jgi:hypothetical protein